MRWILNKVPYLAALITILTFLSGVGYDSEISSAAQDWPTHVYTEDAFNITDTTATLSGTVQNPVGAVPVQVYFEWGLTDAYGNVTEPQVVNTSSYFFYTSYTLTGLTPNTEYHFRATASVVN